jgi:hypothetical protein
MEPENLLKTPNFPDFFAQRQPNTVISWAEGRLTIIYYLFDLAQKSKIAYPKIHSKRQKFQIFTWPGHSLD